MVLRKSFLEMQFPFLVIMPLLALLAIGVQTALHIYSTAIRVELIIGVRSPN